MLVVLLVLLRVWWGFEADRRMQAAIEAYRATGQPVTIEEIDALTPDVPDEDNAAILYEQVLQQTINTTTAGVSLTEFLLGDRSFKDDPQAALELYNRNEKPRMLARQARKRPQVAWSYTLAEIANNPRGWPWPQLSSPAKLLCFAAGFEFAHDDDAQAWESIAGALDYSDAIAAQRVIIGELMSWGSVAITVDCVEQHARRLSRAGASADPSVRQTATELIERLLDVEAAQTHFQLAMLGERAWAIHQWKSDEISGTFRSSTVAPGVAEIAVDYLIAPACVTDIARLVCAYSVAVNLAALPRFPRTYEIFAAPDVREAHFKALFRPSTRRFHEDFAPLWFGRMYTSIAERRMAAIAIAVRLYERDHGAVPPAIESLVPDYLPDLPEDPFAGAGMTFGYAPQRAEPVLYSVGMNGTDEKGERSVEGLECAPDCDFVFHLNGDPVRRPEVGQNSSQAVKDNGDGEREQKTDDYDAPE